MTVLPTVAVPSEFRTMSIMPSSLLSTLADESLNDAVESVRLVYFILSAVPPSLRTPVDVVSVPELLGMYEKITVLSSESVMTIGRSSLTALWYSRFIVSFSVP